MQSSLQVNSPGYVPWEPGTFLESSEGGIHAIARGGTSFNCGGNLMFSLDYGLGYHVEDPCL